MHVQQQRKKCQRSSTLQLSQKAKLHTAIQSSLTVYTEGWFGIFNRLSMLIAPLIHQIWSPLTNLFMSMPETQPLKRAIDLYIGFLC